MTFQADFLNVKRSWVQQMQLQITTLVAITAAFSISLFALNVTIHLRELLSVWGQQIQISAYVKDDAQPEDVKAFEKELVSNANIETHHQVTPDQAIEIFQRQTASFAPDLLSDPEMGKPFPGSYRIRLISTTDVKGVEEVAKRLSKFAAIEDVTYGQSWIQNYAGFVRGISSFSVFLVIVTLACCLLVVGNAIRSALSQRRDEIEVLELLGATQSSIRRPYVVEGFVIGLIGSVAAMIFNGVLAKFQADMLAASPLLARLAETGIGAISAWHLLVPVVGGCIGALGAWLAVRRINTGWAASERSVL